MHFILMFLSYFRTKLRKKIFFFTKILCFIYFLCIGIDLVPQKTLIQKVQFKLWKNNPGPQADTASYVINKYDIIIINMSFPPPRELGRVPRDMDGWRSSGDTLLTTPSYTSHGSSISWNPISPSHLAQIQIYKILDLTLYTEDSTSMFGGSKDLIVLALSYQLNLHRLL